MIDVGPVHDDQWSPVPSAGTSPDAIAPAIAPRKNGVTIDDNANITPKRRASPIVAENLRNANAAPRSTMPRPTSAHGTTSVVMIATNASGKPVHRNTITKISHTWLASHTGPRLASMRARSGPPLRGPPAVRSHTPVPKSAPPKIA